jgi:hypothetical protein
VLRRALLLLLLPLILGACAVAGGGPSSSPSADSFSPIVDDTLLQQWSAWSVAPGRRSHCAHDPRSDLYFVAAPAAQGNTDWSCRVPTGASMVVVAASMAGVTLPMCSRDYSEEVGVDGSASLDGLPVALRWEGPVAGAAGAGARVAPERICALTGITVPLTAGHHTLITQYIVSGLIGTVTVDINGAAPGPA